jgi:hypothetical protein
VFNTSAMRARLPLPRDQQLNQPFLWIGSSSELIAPWPSRGTLPTFDQQRLVAAAAWAAQLDDDDERLHC